MPLYEYKCASCGEVFEVLQKFSDEPLATHPACGGPVERLLSPPAFQFKGTGWYVTDYARKSNGSSGGHSGGHSKHADNGKTESKTESKPAETKPAATSASDKKAG